MAKDCHEPPGHIYDRYGMLASNQPLVCSLTMPTSTKQTFVTPSFLTGTQLPTTRLAAPSPLPAFYHISAVVVADKSAAGWDSEWRRRCKHERHDTHDNDSGDDWQVITGDEDNACSRAMACHPMACQSMLQRPCHVMLQIKWHIAQSAWHRPHATCHVTCQAMADAM